MDPAVQSTINSTTSSVKDPASIKDKIYQRLLLKMGGKFGDDPGTLKVISSILQGYIKDGRKLKPDDIDQMETDIFQRLSNVSKNIALD